MCVFIAHVQYVVSRFYRKIKLIKIQCAEIVEHVQQNAQPGNVKPKIYNVKLSCTTKIYDSLAPYLIIKAETQQTNKQTNKQTNERT